MTETARQTVRRPASAEQERMLAQMELHPSQAEEICRVWWLHGQLDPERLERALAGTVGAHDMLRARLITPGDHGAEQEIFPDFDGLPRWPVTGGRGRVREVAESIRAEPLASQDRWFQAVLLEFSEGGHALVIRMHHSLVDGYSVLLVEREIWQRYAADAGSAAAEPVPYEDLPVQQTDEAELRRLEQWWARHLAGVRPATVLPDPAVTRAAHRAYQAAELPVELTAEQAAELRALARANRTTVLCLLLAAHLMTLAAFSHDSDVVVATPYLNRDDPVLQEVVGPLVNLLPIRAQPTAGSLAGNVPAVAAALRESVTHAQLPYARMMAGSPRDGDGSGVVRSALTLAPAAGGPAPATGLAIENVPLPTVAVEWDLVTTLSERLGGLAGTLVYRADRYPREIAAAFRDHFLALLTAPTSTPARAAAGLTPRARAAGPTALDELPRLRRLLALTDFQPTDPVTLDQHGGTDRAAFETRVAGYQAVIRRAGDRPRVALGLGSGLEQAAALLAVWRSGGCAVLLDLRHPAQRRADVLANAAPDMTLIEAGAVPDAAGGSAGADLPPPDAVAYLVHTSGTDGRPKGVQITYRNVEYLLGILGELNLPGPGFNPLGPAFDGWIWATLLPWVAGQPVAFPGRGIADLTARIDGRECSVTLTPTMLGQLDPANCPAAIVSAGEPLGTAVADRFAATHRLINAYGPSEATVCASWADTAAGEDPSTIGRPAPGVVIRLLDDGLRPVPLGALGEICLGGPGVARGYLGQAGLTARRFVADPWQHDGGRLYRTGDLGVMGPDGLLRFVTRRDGQAKVSGVRIELDEVANVLRGCPAVREAAAVVVADEQPPVVWAAVVAAGSGVPEMEQLHQACALALLAEARPARIVLVPALPRTASGKLDRALLAETLRGQPAAAATVDGDLAGRIAAVWSRVLSIEVTDHDRSFFEYGGHSLAASRVISTLRRELERAIPTFALFNHPTVNELASWLELNP